MTETTDPRRCGTCRNWMQSLVGEGDCLLHAVPVPADAGTQCQDWEMDDYDE